MTTIRVDKATHARLEALARKLHRPSADIMATPTTRSRRNAIHSTPMALTSANSSVSAAVISCGINATATRPSPSISYRTHLTRRPDGARQAS